ncbi:MAG: TfoX/Sxy family protein [Oscillospiraceae bacterium]|nr:TfoX/Sxy family protein [Oscillospiraceae bacterium]
MASSREYLDFVLDELSELDGITHRAMMGEFIIYYRGRIAGAVCDDRFLVKITKFSRAMMPEACEEAPYEGAKPMLLVDNIEDRAFLRELIEGMYPELPEKKQKRR